MAHFWSSAQDIYLSTSIFLPVALAISILLYPLKPTHLIHDALALKNLTSSHIRHKITHTRKIEWPDWKRIWQDYNRCLVALLATVSMVTARERNYSWLAVVLCWVMAVGHLRERRLVRRVEELDSELDEMAHRAAGAEEAVEEAGRGRGEIVNGRKRKRKG
jgi:hypothetical protein